MSLLRPRAILCPNDGKESADLPAWKASPGNYWWAPRGARYPDSQTLLPGDILLFLPLRPNDAQSFIIRYQSRHGSEEHARYTHAAVYLGLDGLICEATPFSGVKISGLDERIEDACLTVRRAPGLSEAARQAVALGAASHRSVRYGWDSLLNQLWPTFVQRSRGVHTDAEVKSLICSTLCTRALLRAGVAVLPPDRGLVTPAWLSQAPELADVAVEWRGTAESAGSVAGPPQVVARAGSESRLK